jgi:thioredoxin
VVKFWHLPGMPSAHVFDVTDADFEARVIERSQQVPVVVDFWAPWCAPCRMMAPELETAARSMAGKALVIKVNTDGLPELGERFRILTIPTLALFRGGKEVSRFSGVRPAADIEALVARS